MKANIEARKRFGVLGDANLVLHHIDPTLKERDPERYNEWRDEDLVVMTVGEHVALHNKLGPSKNRYTDEWRANVKKGMEKVDMSAIATQSMAKFRTGKPQPYTRGAGNYHRVSIKCVETGKEYESVYEAYCDTGITYQNINAVLRGARKSAGGYHWVRL